ncbi:MAG TPA: cell division protein ZapD, partial [Gammaproteobacteria bacterium]|nr:cell division protein ZapD [Gammaproteobacteria bacterium]
RNADTRIADLRHWYGSLDTLRLSVDLILKLIRESATPVDRTAEGGLYQQGLDSATPFQLIRVSLPGDSPYFAEISGGRHRFTVRLLQASTGERARQATADIPFQLSCCAL